jgi:predicted LPLAT superfamily acyltransferase
MSGRRRDSVWNGVTGGGAFGQMAMRALFSVVNVRVGYCVLVVVVPFYMLFARRGFRAIYRYFRRRHGFRALKAFCMTYRNHFLFGQMILDRFAVYAGQRKGFRFENPDKELFLEMMRREGGCIIAASHVGNPELCGYLLFQQTKRMNSLVFGGEAEVVQRYRAEALGSNNVRLIPVGEDLSHVFLIHEALTGGEMLIVPCDRFFGSGRTLECTFLNAKARFPTGAFALARRYEVPVIALFVVKVTAARYRIHVLPVAPRQEEEGAGLSRREQVDAMTRSFVAVLERMVRRYPEQWFNFYDFWNDGEVSRS